ncbi:glycosyltransferase [Streptomyces sp. 900105755]|uniref:glycosyltransferase n=1 Tax=Streptomyces sp. 900105755 TaxID=3154389 RepID=UPI003318D683
MRRHATRRAHAAPEEPGDRPRLAVLIPAHNEQERISAAIDGLWEQTRRPDLIVVVTDNCTDDTAGVAAAHGAQVFPTRGDIHNGIAMVVATTLVAAGVAVFKLVQTGSAEAVAGPFVW